MYNLLIYDRETDIIKEAEELKILVNNLCCSSTESFKSIMLAIYEKIMSLIGSIALTFKRGVLRAFRDLKQTELEEFSYKNSVFLNKFKRVNYNNIRGMKILYPDGLTTTYYDVTNKVVVCLASFNMLDRSKSFLDICNTIYDSVKSKKYKRDIPALQENFSDVNSSKKYFEDFIKCYTKKKLPDKLPFGDLFLSMQEYVSTKDLLENNDKYQFQVARIHRNIDDCNELMKRCIKTIQSDNEVQESITKEDLLSMSNACMFFAKTVDMFGSTIMDFHTIEHNFVEMLKYMKKQNVC